MRNVVSWKPLVLGASFLLYGAGTAFATETDHLYPTPSTGFMSVQQDGRQINCHIVDKSGPIVGANVVVKGTTIGNISDMDGRFTLEVSEDAVLKFTYVGYLPQEIELYPNLTVQECLEYMGDLAGVPKAECRKRIDYYLKKTSLIEHRKKKMKQLSGGMKRRVGLVQALLNEPEFLIVDEPTTGLDPEERIRIRNLLVDFSENRTVLFSTHVVEDLAATCNQLAIMHKGRFLYAGSMKNLTEEAQGKIWICKVPDERKAREVEQKYRITSKQYVEGGLQLRVISEIQPELECMSIPATLEDAYIYVTNQYE